MITALVTRATIDNWKALFDRFAPSMSSNRKTGAEVDAYFRDKYQYSILKSEDLERVVKMNIMENQCFREKLLQGAEPDIKCYSVDDVMVGIDLSSGYFQVESGDTEKMASIYDDLFVFRGLDSTDLKNYVLVGQYFELTENDNLSMAFCSKNPDL